MKVSIDLQNTCACLDEQGAPNEVCFGDCWAEQVDLFRDLTAHLFNHNRQVFRITGQTWRAGHPTVYIGLYDGEQLISSMAPNLPEWQMNLDIYEDRIEARLWRSDYAQHFDMTVTPLSIEDVARGDA